MSDINLKIALEAVSKLAADLKRERDEAAKEALYYNARYEHLKDSMNVVAEKFYYHERHAKDGCGLRRR